MRKSDLEEFHRQYLCHPWQVTDEMELRKTGLGISL